MKMLFGNANRIVRRARRGFSLVELLAVVLILAVLAAVAVPVYMNQRTAAADRACRSNVKAIAAAESHWLLEHSSYATTVGELVTGSSGGGLAAEPLCPADNSPYTITTADGVTTVKCTNATHTADGLHTTTLAVPAALGSDTAHP